MRNTSTSNLHLLPSVLSNETGRNKGKIQILNNDNNLNIELFFFFIAHVNNLKETVPGVKTNLSQFLL